MKQLIFRSSMCLLVIASLSIASPLQKNGMSGKPQAEPDAAQKDQIILPPSFTGWQKAERTAKISTDPAAASSSDAAVLKEYGFSDVESATYSRDDRKMQVKAVRFHDASGAYGAFTFYVDPQMLTAKIPDQGVANSSRILFYRGNILVEAALDRVTAMSASDLRALSDALPQIHGPLATPPSLPRNIPPQSYVPHTSRYVMGPVALERLGLPIPAALVDFNKGAEVEFAKYRSSIGEGQLTLISYPTPQIALERMKAIQSASLPGGPFYFKRSAPFVVVVNGDIPANEAQSLLASVNYDAEVTLNEPTKPSAKDNPGSFIVAIVVLIMMLMTVALILGFAFGGVRVWVKKHYPNSIFDRPEDIEIIQLNLK
ncbi:MAG TPA: DUF6599 family protein [Candidatus Angelobacter sp.]|jgi:hypothetical protein|nr:DUF6599 family protein [Candidatus Angelobacter sp.]